MLKVLPEPLGPYAIGSVTHRIKDSNRAVSLVNEELGRALFIKIWYPCNSLGVHDGNESLWEQLTTADGLPGPMRWLYNRVKDVQTHTLRNALFDNSIVNPHLVIYNHGLISFASENTSLMECLASHGCVVVAIQHEDQHAELQQLQSIRSKQKRTNDKQMSRKLKKAKLCERAQIAREYYICATNTNQIVAERTLDTQFVLSNIDNLRDLIPGHSKTTETDDTRSCVGLSLGGAVSTEYAKSDSSVKAVVNIDGGIYGTLIDHPITSPYLMMYSGDNKDINSQVLRDDGQWLKVQNFPEANHLNFHDIALLFPRLLKILKALGRVDAPQTIENRNIFTARFLAEIHSTLYS